MASRREFPRREENYPMAYQSKTQREQLAWMTLKADDTRLPEELCAALANLEDIKGQIEDMVRQALPPAKGKKWVFAYKHGVGIALTDASSSTSVDYFTRR
jgi:hypothetical protein